MKIAFINGRRSVFTYGIYIQRLVSKKENFCNLNLLPLSFKFKAIIFNSENLVIISW